MADDLDDLICFVCLDYFRNPAIIPCGHSFCKDCITCVWDQDVCRCPQCKQTFPDKPAVTDWLQVKELSDKLLKMRTEAEDEDAEAHEVSCDSCSSRRSKAVRSCLTCVSSYCSDHLEKHNELHGWRKHLLTEATDLKSKTCSQHEKLIDVFCRTDQKCVCVLCAVYEHKNHDTVSASEERQNRQRKLMETRETFLQNIQDREKDFKELKQVEETVKCSAQTAVAESERIFSDVVCAVQKTCVDVKELITERQRDELSHIEGLQEKVQQKISHMRMKVSELDQFMTTQDHIHFLQNYPSDREESTSEEFQDLSSISENTKAFFRNVELLLSKMQERLLDVTKETEIKIKSGEEEKSTQERSDADVEIVFERKPTADQAELAAGLKLPHTFFCYRNDPGYASHEEDDDDDEDFEGAVRSLKGQLYPDAVAGCDAGAATETQNQEEKNDDDDDDDEAVNNVELPSVEENEEEILFNERTKLFLWDRDNNKWKSCGAGDIKILFHPVRKRYRVFMCQEKDKKLCANHCITRTTHPKPLHTNANALTWTAADYSDGDGVIQQFAAKFKTPDLTDSFKKTLTDCQCHMSEFMQPSKE